MGDDALTDFILKSRQRGRSDEQILRNLISVGWKKERIDSAFAALSAKKIQSPTGMPQKEEPEETVSTPEKEEMAPEKKQPAPAAKDAQPEKAALPPSQVPSNASPAQPQAKKQMFSFSFGKKAEPPPSQPVATPPKAPEKVEPPQPASPPWSSVSLARKPSPQINPPPIPSQQVAAASHEGAPELQPSAYREKGTLAQPGTVTSPSGESSVKMPPVLRPVWPSEKEGAALPTTVYPRVENEAQVQNPAFSNLERATGAGGVMKFAPLLAVIIILIAGAAAYYFFVLHAPSAIPVAGNNTANTIPPSNRTIAPAVNSTQETGANNSSSGNGALNSTSPPPPPVQQPANVSEPANNSTAAQQPQAHTNASAAPPAAQQPGSVQANNSSSAQPPAAANNSTAQSFKRFRTYTDSTGKLPSKYCASLGGAVTRIHYFEYYGIECSSEKGTGGYTNESGFLADKCRYLTSVPCCFDSNNSAYSYLYDSFECGFYS